MALVAQPLLVGWTSLSETIFDAGLRRATVQQYIATYNADLAALPSNRAHRIPSRWKIRSPKSASCQSKSSNNSRPWIQHKLFSSSKQGRYETGIDPYINVLIAQTTVLGDQQTLTNLQVQQMTAAVALVEALGGGWDRSQLPTPRQVTEKPPKPIRPSNTSLSLANCARPSIAFVFSLHHDLAGHLRVERAVVGKRSRLGKRVGKLFVRIPHLGFEHTVCADHRMGNVITVRPGNCRSDGYRERLRPKTEIVDFHLRARR